MGLLETLNAAKNGTLTSNSSGLTDGTYPVKLIASEFQVTSWGQEQASFNFEVVSGDKKGTREYVNVSFDQDAHPYKQQLAADIVNSLTDIFKLDLNALGVKDEITLADAFRTAIGKQASMTLTLTENQDKTKKPYRNHTFAPLGDDTEITELGELPF